MSGVFQGDDPLLILGELRGQLRELNHGFSNMAQERQAIVRQLAKLETIPERLTSLETRLTTLETDRYRRDGAVNLGTWLVKSPFVAWLVAGAVWAWAYFKGSPA